MLSTGRVDNRGLCLQSVLFLSYFLAQSRPVLEVYFLLVYRDILVQEINVLLNLILNIKLKIILLHQHTAVNIFANRDMLNYSVPEINMSGLIFVLTYKVNLRGNCFAF